jgi:hypothetical protein
LVGKLDAEHTEADGNSNGSTSQIGDLNLEASFLESELLLVLSSDYTPELIPVITEPAPEESYMANAPGMNEGEQNTKGLLVTT